MPLRARLYITAVLANGAGFFAAALARWTCADPVHYLCNLLIAMCASLLSVPVPGISSTMSVSYVYVVLGLMDFSYPETVVLACAAILPQSVWRARSGRKPLKLAFNLANMVIAVS